MAYKQDRVKTGIEGFDEICDGGLIRDRSYLLAGGSGAGKTIFAVQFLYNGIVQYGEKGVFVATEERPEQIRRDVLNFGWDLRKLEEDKKLAIIDASATKIGIPSHERYVDVRPFDLRSLIDQVVTVQEEIDAQRAVVDSTTAIGYSLGGEVSKIRVELLKLAATLDILGLTSLLTCEVVDESHPSRFGVEPFVTEGTIAMYYSRTENVRVRSIEIFKMRGSEHSRKLHPFEVASRGIVVHPHEEVYV